MKKQKKKASKKYKAHESCCSLCGQRAYIKQIHNGAFVYWPIDGDVDEFERLSPPEILKRKRDHAKEIEKEQNE